MTTGIDRIAIERMRQITGEGYDGKHDDEHDDGSLALAAACYSASAAGKRIYVKSDFASSIVFEDPWPWEDAADRRPYDGNVLKAPDEDISIRLLEKAGALIAAEIDRRLRAAGTPKKKR